MYTRNLTWIVFYYVPNFMSSWKWKDINSSKYILEVILSYIFVFTNLSIVSKNLNYYFKILSINYSSIYT
jgi:hypothetical protein